jgi:hypothetical protein
MTLSHFFGQEEGSMVLVIKHQLNGLDHLFNKVNIWTIISSYFTCPDEAI